MLSPPCQNPCPARCSASEPIKLRKLEFGILAVSKIYLPTSSCPSFTNTIYRQYFLSHVLPYLCGFFFYLIPFICIFKMYPNQIQNIKISHGLRLSENIKLFNAPKPGFSDLKLSNVSYLPQYPILPLSNCNLVIITIRENWQFVELSLIANLRSFIIETWFFFLKKKIIIRQGTY